MCESNSLGGEGEWWPAGPALESIVARCVEMALAGIQREFPCALPMTWDQPHSLQRPRDLTPVFFGCYDWHSAVHSHWLLVRAARWFPHAVWVPRIVELLEQQFQSDPLQREFEFLSSPIRTGFERPYGLAWLLQLVAELHQSDLPCAAVWRERFRPLERLAADRFAHWLPRLSGPIRSGEHSQTAFAMSLIHDWALTTRDPYLHELVVDTALKFHVHDDMVPVDWEPSAHDFLSPSLASADLIRRCLAQADDFQEWLQIAGLLPERLQDVLLPVAVSDPSDGKLAHFAGLNFSRAWMLSGISDSLPHTDPRRAWYLQRAWEHLEAGISSLNSEEYAITHWVGSFAVYALTSRGKSLPDCRVA